MGKSPYAHKNADFVAELVRTVGPTDECIPWPRARDKNGYGKAYRDGQHLLTHRISYEVFIGSIPDGQLVLHSCDNPPCINPEHLSVGTNLDNQRDSHSKGRANRALGEAHGQSILTNEIVLEIRNLHHNALMRGCDIAKLLCVTPQMICEVLTGNHWSHVQ